MSTGAHVRLQVMIKELRFAERARLGNAEGRNRSDELRVAAFFKEVRLLTRFRHPNIARVVSIFEAKRPTGSTLKFLSLVRRKGFEVLAQSKNMP